MPPFACRRTVIPAALLLAVTCGGAGEGVPDLEPVIELDEDQLGQWARLWEEQQATALLVDLSQRWRPSDRPLVVDHVTVIPMTGQSSRVDQTVIIEDGVFRAVGPIGAVQRPDGAERIDGRGLFLIPGLVESHSHTISSPSQFLVYLSRGVTTLREMDGFPWMLEARERAARNELLIPNLLVAGHILSHRPWDFYMTGVESADEARTLVREQVAAGYDFIKIHNSMPQPLFGAILETARETGVDVVGHIPNEISIAEAIAAGFRTNEHFKGYLYDETLEITDQDFVSATRGSELWNTPTFTTYHTHLRGAESRALAEEEGSLPLVPRWMRRMWHRESDQMVDELTKLRQTIYPKSREIFARIRPVTDRFLAGTDTGTYSYLVPGFALQEEVRIFEELGLTPAEALATATVHPARAFRRESIFGTVEVGKRADFVLLAANPLESTRHLREIEGVGLRGVFLARQRLDEIEQRLGEVFSDSNSIPRPTRTAFERFAEQAQEMASSGWPAPAYAFEEVAEFLRAVGCEDLAGPLGF